MPNPNEGHYEDPNKDNDPADYTNYQDPSALRPRRRSLAPTVGILLGVVGALTWAVTTLFEIAVAKALAIVILVLFSVAVLMAITLLGLGIM